MVFFATMRLERRDQLFSKMYSDIFILNECPENRAEFEHEKAVLTTLQLGRFFLSY
jgi:hypothetical protein